MNSTLKTHYDTANGVWEVTFRTSDEDFSESAEWYKDLLSAVSRFDRAAVRVGGESVQMGSVTVTEIKRAS